MGDILPLLHHSTTPSLPPLTRADSGIEGIIYIVILIIWGISQAIRKSRKGDQPMPGPAVPRPPNQMPDDLRTMLETLTGQKFEPIRAPPPPPPLPTDVAPCRDRVPRRRAPVPQAVQMRSPPPRWQPEATAIQVELSHEIPRSVVASLTLKGLTSGMKSVRIPTANTGMAMPMASHFGTGRGSPVLDLRDRNRLRRAIMGRILLGPPKALASSPMPEA
ncbi:MAG: hypothetical protein V1929_06710 [bacterium]